jgi:hypothetical protein
MCVLYVILFSFLNKIHGREVNKDTEPRSEAEVVLMNNKLSSTDLLKTRVES